MRPIYPLFLLTLAFFYSLQVRAEIRFPANAKLINVTLAPYHAKGDGVTDDSDAIETALKRTGIIYFPAGTYIITRPLVVPPRTGSAPARRILQGAGQDLTILSIRDNSPAFNNANKPNLAIKLSWGVAQAFRNSVRDLTIDTGSGNPGAKGLGFMASNQGALREVTIRSSDGKGHTGIELNLGDNGPLLIKKVKVSGFGTGINAKYGQSFTLENVNIDKCRIGINNQHAMLFMRNMAIEAREVGITNESSSVTALWDSSIKARLGIHASGNVRVENLNSKANISIRRGKQTITADHIDSYGSLPPLKRGNTDGITEMKAKNTPSITRDPVELWRSFPNPKESVSMDDVQTLANTASTLYLNTQEKLSLKGNTTIPASLNRVTGLERSLSKATEWTLDINEPSDDPFVLERFDSIYTPIKIIVSARRPVVLSSLILDSVTVGKGAGPVFFEDVVCQRLDMGKGAEVYARQLNMEYAKVNKTHIHNNGGYLWCLGFKNEGDATMLKTTNGGVSLFTGYILANKATPSASKPPLFVVENATMDAMWGESVIRKQPYGTLLIHDEKKALTTKDVPKRSNQGSTVSQLLVAPAEQ